MMETNGYTFHRLGRMMFQQLEDNERAQVLETMRSLAAIPVDQWTAPLAKRLPGDEPFYLVRVNDNRRLIVRAAEGQPPEVRDITTQEKIDFFAKLAETST